MYGCAHTHVLPQSVLSDVLVCSHPRRVAKCPLRCMDVLTPTRVARCLLRCMGMLTPTSYGKVSSQMYGCTHTHVVLQGVLSDVRVCSHPLRAARCPLRCTGVLTSPPCGKVSSQMYGCAHTLACCKVSCQLYGCAHAHVVLQDVLSDVWGVFIHSRAANCPLRCMGVLTPESCCKVSSRMYGCAHTHACGKMPCKMYG